MNMIAKFERNIVKHGLSWTVTVTHVECDSLAYEGNLKEALLE